MTEKIPHSRALVLPLALLLALLLAKPLKKEGQIPYISTNAAFLAFT